VNEGVKSEEGVSESKTRIQTLTHALTSFAGGVTVGSLD
jgi:hypothetical protein